MKKGCLDCSPIFSNSDFSDLVSRLFPMEATVEKINSTRLQCISLCAFALLATALVCAISWPGFMSFDSMYALKQAREGIETGGYPPMVSYVWFVCDQLLSGQGGMFILQNALVFFGIVKLGRSLAIGPWRIASAIVIVMLSPMTLGPMLVVWKDVAFAGWLLFAYAYTFDFLRHDKRSKLCLAVFFITMGSCFRLNGIAAALPALALIACRLSGIKTPLQKNGDVMNEPARLDWRNSVLAAGIFSSMIVFVFGCVVLSSTWRLPDLKKIDMATGSGWTQMGDLVGISVCAKRNLIPGDFYTGTMPMQRIEALYFPEHSQRSFGASPLLDESGFVGNQALIDATVAQARKKYWRCYLQHRIQLMKFALGANRGDVFYLTDPNVFPGVQGTELVPTKLTSMVTSYLQMFASAPWSRCIVFGAVASLFWVIAFVGERRQLAIMTLLPLAGSVSYLAASFLILPAADARYNFIVSIVFIFSLCALWPDVLNMSRSRARV